MSRQPPYNLGYRFGADLKAIPEDPVSMGAYVDFLNEQLRAIPRPVPSDRVRATVKLLGEVGAYAAILRRLPQAQTALEESLRLIEEHSLGAAVWAVHTLRFGDVLRFQKNDLAAETAFRSVLELGSRDREVGELKDFAWQHLGKLRFDEGKLKDAEECFQQALKLRQAKGIKELIASTELALRVLKMK